ncbi:hypothetical protein TELCIR_16794 [Teladorsagia circumcincta]|uniref:Uncharacterized protein n=1 Tax=Teladorsagia circumcincta TaxID=45464 RepID=A0A2G9TUS7_TELCI|nr:hypothetical protein TELCIR_16794 [Teladorsagia circumcincta]
MIFNCLSSQPPTRKKTVSSNEETGEKEKQNCIAKGAGHVLDFELLKRVRLPLRSPEFLVNTVSDNLLISEDVDCRDLVDEAKIGDAP